ncbi:MAG: sigma-70 family RNA polymerase sigma factor [Planctomycetes bacterium]|nr:sigma-70 family RNA polymerase sigma factor [Planctomycetota bacterium]
MGKETIFSTTGGGFPTTRWTRLLQIRESGTARSREQVQVLFSIYWPVVRGVIFRQWTRDPEEADDLTQEFFLSLLERDFSKDLAPDKGRFRHFIKAALKHFLLNRRRDERRLKRGGGARVVSIDDPAVAEVAAEQGVEGFDRDWARCLLKAAVDRLREFCAASDRRKHFEAFQLHYPPDRPEEALPYPQIAERLAIPYHDVGNYLKWARAKMREIVLELIAEYAGGAEAARRELEDLFP